MTQPVYPRPDDDAEGFAPPAPSNADPIQYDLTTKQIVHMADPDAETLPVPPVPVSIIERAAPNQIKRLAISSFLLDPVQTMTPTLLIGYMPNRTQLAIKNIGDGNLFVGIDASVGPNVNGYKLAPGEGLVLSAVNAIWGYVDASLTVCLAWEYVTEYNSRRNKKGN